MGSLAELGDVFYFSFSEASLEDGGSWGLNSPPPTGEGFALGMDPRHHPRMLGVPRGTRHQRVPDAFTRGCFYTHADGIP